MANSIPRKLIKAGDIDLADLVNNIKVYVKQQKTDVYNEMVSYVTNVIGGLDTGDDITNVIGITNIVGQNMVVGNAMPDFSRATIMCQIRDTKCSSQGCGFVYKINVPGWIYLQAENVGKNRIVASNSLIAAQKPTLLFMHGSKGNWNSEDFPCRGYEEFTQLHPMECSVSHSANGTVMWPIMPGDSTYVRMVSQTTSGDPYLVFAPCKGVPNETYDASYNPITMQKFVYGWNPLLNRSEWQSSYFTRVGTTSAGGLLCSNTAKTANRPDTPEILRTWEGDWKTNFATKSSYTFESVTAGTRATDGAVYVVENTGTTPTSTSSVVDVSTWDERKVPVTEGKTYYRRTERKYMELILPTDATLNSDTVNMKYSLNEIMVYNPGGISSNQTPTTLYMAANGVLDKGIKGYHRFTSYGMATDPRLMIYQCHATAHVLTYRDYRQIHYVLFHEYKKNVNDVGTSSTSINATNVRYIHESAFSSNLWEKKYIGGGVTEKDASGNEIYGLYIKTSTAGNVKFFTKTEILYPDGDSASGYVKMSGKNYYLKWLLLSADRWCICENTAYRLCVSTNSQSNSESWDYDKIYDSSKLTDIYTRMSYSDGIYTEIAPNANSICRWIPGVGGTNITKFSANVYFMTCCTGLAHIPYNTGDDANHGDGQWMVGCKISASTAVNAANIAAAKTSYNTLATMPNHWNIPAGTISGVSSYIGWTSTQCLCSRWIPPMPYKTSTNTGIGYDRLSSDKQGETDQ